MLASWSSEVVRNATLSVGVTDYPFYFELKPNLNRQLYETYHGVSLAVQYLVKADVKRSFPQKSIHKSQEFVVNYAVLAVIYIIVQLL